VGGSLVGMPVTATVLRPSAPGRNQVGPISLTPAVPRSVLRRSIPRYGDSMRGLADSKSYSCSTVSQSIVVTIVIYVTFIILKKSLSKAICFEKNGYLSFFTLAKVCTMSQWWPPASFTVLQQDVLRLAVVFDPPGADKYPRLFQPFP